MADTFFKADPKAFDKRMQDQGQALHAKDRPPASRKEWEERRKALRTAMFSAMGPFPEKPCPLQPRVLGTLKRDGYRIEKLVFQTRPDVWVTASAYVPEPVKGKHPAVLVVHGHWAGARRDPVVQARCLGLVKLGFFVLAVDAFGSGERYTAPARGTYHGALYGSTLWPSGQTLLGLQVYDNRRAVDYLCSRPEVDGTRLGITGASGGGNQTMYAGALDDRFQAVVPVCSVGTYQAYLHAACCVCEALPGGLRLAEEGDVLSLVAPRSLMVVSATRDGFQFSVGEAKKSLARAETVFKLLGAGDRLRHAIFESRHDYNQPMREVMYGWMTRWLKGEGEGKPIPEPRHTVESADDLACYPPGSRPKTFLLLPELAARESLPLVRKHNSLKPKHAEDWESAAVYMRSRLKKEIFGGFPLAPKPAGKLNKPEEAGDVRTVQLLLHPEPGMPLPVTLKFRTGRFGRIPACVLLHLDGGAEALKHPLAQSLIKKGWEVLAPDLRATGLTKRSGDAIRGAPDHNSAEHALWVGRPLLGQWVFDVSCLLDWMAIQPGLNGRHFALVGLGQAGVVALCAGGLLDDRVASVASVDSLTSYVTDQPYADGTRMGLLAPGILRVGDVPHLASLVAPRPLQIVGGVSALGKKLGGKELSEAFGFTAGIYRLHKAEKRLSVVAEARTDEIASRL
jgi:dienelactone hydrolase/pimeloyl-ACP methyl ester carboxylesterase